MRPAVLVAVTGVALAIAVAGSLAASTKTSLAGPITVRSWETLKPKPGEVTGGGTVGTGRFRISGVVTDAGAVTSYRTVRGNKVTIRRVTVGKRGSITFRITITMNDYSPPPWVITSASKAYGGIRGKGTEVVSELHTTPARFVLKGTVRR